MTLSPPNNSRGVKARHWQPSSVDALLLSRGPTNRSQRVGALIFGALYVLLGVACFVTVFMEVREIAQIGQERDATFGIFILSFACLGIGLLFLVSGIRLLKVSLTTSTRIHRNRRETSTRCHDV